MENNQDIQNLIASFVEYRNLFTPIEENLRLFADTYQTLRDEVQKIGKSLDGNLQEKLEGIYKDINSQFEKTQVLSTQIESFKQKTDEFSAQMQKLLNVLGAIDNKIERLDSIEDRAIKQIDKLDQLIEKKDKTYNVKELEDKLESYNLNIQKVSEFINKDIGIALKDTSEKIGYIRDKNESMLENLLAEKSNIEELVKQYTASNQLLKRVAEKEDINEEYVFDLLDKWASKRKIKTKKWGFCDARRDTKTFWYH